MSGFAQEAAPSTIILAEPLQLDNPGFLKGQRDITLFEEREFFLEAVVKAKRPPQDISDPRTLDLSGAIQFRGEKPSEGEFRIHAASSHGGKQFSVTIRKPPEDRGTINWDHPFLSSDSEMTWKELETHFCCKGMDKASKIEWDPGKDEVFGATPCDVAEILGPLVFDRTSVNAGLVLLTGGTGTGKTTVLNGLLLRYLHECMKTRPERRPHVVAVGDPVETTLDNPKIDYAKRAIDFTSRTIGIDVSSVRAALRDALRETPAAVVISELRDPEDFKATLEFAETGQLVIATAHSTSLVDAMRKLMSFSLHPESPGGRSLLAQRLKAVIHLRKVNLLGTQAPNANDLNRMTITLPSVWLHNSGGIRNFVSDGLASILPRSGDRRTNVFGTGDPAQAASARRPGADNSATAAAPTGSPVHSTANADLHASNDSAPIGSTPNTPNAGELNAQEAMDESTGKFDLGVLGLAWAVENLIRVKEKNDLAAFGRLKEVERFLMELAHTIDLEA